MRAFALATAFAGAGLLTAPAQAEEATGAQAARLVRELEAHSADRALLAPSLDRAKHALERAANARRAGDHRHGSELEALALELAQSAVDLRREKQVQASVSETEEKALAAETRVLRARALVEQTAARRGRAAERLHELEAEKAKPGGADTKKTPDAKKPPAASTPDAQKAAPATPAVDGKKPAPAAPKATKPGTP